MATAPPTCLFFNPTNGALNAFRDRTISRPRPGKALAASIPAAGFQIAGIGDFNGDGTDDILFFNPANGALNAFEVHNFTATAWQGVGSIDPGAGNTIAGVGDYNGDGTADVLFYDQTTGGVHAFEVHNFVATGGRVSAASREWHVV